MFASCFRCWNGKEAVEHKKHAHMGVFWMFDVKGLQNTKNVPIRCVSGIWQLRVWWWKPQTQKIRRKTHFLCSCEPEPVGMHRLRGVGEDDDEHVKHAPTGMFYMFVMRGRTRKTTNMKNMPPGRVFCVCCGGAG